MLVPGFMAVVKATAIKNDDDVAHMRQLRYRILHGGVLRTRGIHFLSAISDIEYFIA